MGNNTRFWLDAWLCRFTLKDIFPNLYKLEVFKGCLIRDRVVFDGNRAGNFVWGWSKLHLSEENLVDAEDLQEMVCGFSFKVDKKGGWRWTGDSSGLFSVRSLRGCMAIIYMGMDLLFIPVAINLIAKGLNSIYPECSRCHSAPETSAHVFLDCPREKEVWRAVSLWCHWDLTGFDSFGQLLEVAKQPDDNLGRRILGSIIYSSIWFIWRQRNAKLFNNGISSTLFTMEEIMTNLFGWIKNRSGHKDIVWLDWIKAPLSCFKA
ncbi:uncharacterized protein LOC143579700 [Bidens hawaiensis]|uniref:uncharacterized protein LOC143579700 n=1 Tax=Bidens hawaiensis TaxID=980011 RepID=UPI004049EC33